jgi:F-type H+-transporting ATPase subunit delta
MRITKQSRREAKNLFRNCLVDGQLNEQQVRASVQRVLDEKPRGYLATLAHFQRLLKLHLDSRRVRVESAIPDDPNLRSRVEAALARRYGPGLDVQYHVDPALLGGLRVRVGSDVYDGTIHARLEELKANL